MYPYINFENRQTNTKSISIQGYCVPRYSDLSRLSCKQSVYKYG